MTGARTELRKLTLPYAALETVYQGDCEVRQYRNELTGQLQVGKRIDILGMDVGKGAQRRWNASVRSSPGIARF